MIESASVMANTVDENYFDILGLSIVRGRGFRSVDTPDSPRVAIVNNAFAEKYLGRDPIGPKLRQGDSRTPEGIYQIDRRQAESHYHLALHISYPSTADTARARAEGVDPGGAIFIHGYPVGFEWADPALLRLDWTAGCIAVSDRAIEEIWRMVADGTVIEIRP